MADAPPSKILNKRNPRRNLPGLAARKRTEGCFVLAFERAYIAKCFKGHNFKIAREVPVNGFGVADFVWISCHGKTAAEGSAVSGSDLATSAKTRVIAFEMKLTDWIGGIAQAARYRFYANESFLVLPYEIAKVAKKRANTFKAAGVGLIGFDAKSGEIRTLIASEKGKPLSNRAHQLLLSRLRSLSQFKVEQAGSL